MTYAMKHRGCDSSRNRGMPDRMIVSHQESNHGGAVKRLDRFDEQLDEFDFTSAPGLLADRLKRAQLIATNSMILDEVSFAGLGDEREPGASLNEAPARDSARTTRGVPNSLQWARRSVAAAAGCCSRGRHASANSPISRMAAFNRTAVQRADDEVRK
ncbi:MAG: hypothetical protein H8K06_20780 [Nitrospira sp.]|nr:hypothetical protein [Nitrospira sp.]